MTLEIVQPALIDEALQPPAPPGREHEAERFWRFVDVRGPMECWPWTGGKTTRGYGRFSTWRAGAEKKVYPHRWVFEAFHGRLLAGLTIDHLCDSPPCCNPLHLAQVTQGENTLRGTSPAALNALKTVCDNGHEFTPENTYFRTDGTGRRCRACDREAQRRKRAMKRKDAA